MIKLEYGKRYARRDGQLTGPLTTSPDDCILHPLCDPRSGRRYTGLGRIRFGRDWETHDEDLVSEYFEPSAASVIKKGEGKMTKPLDISDVSKLQTRDGREVLAVFVDPTQKGTDSELHVVIKDPEGSVDSYTTIVDGRYLYSHCHELDIVMKPAPKIKCERWGFYILYKHEDVFLNYDSQGPAETARELQLSAGRRVSQVFKIEGEIE